MNIRHLMHHVGEQSQRDEVFQAVWLTIFQARRNKLEGEREEEYRQRRYSYCHTQQSAVIYTS